MRAELCNHERRLLGRTQHTPTTKVTRLKKDRKLAHAGPPRSSCCKLWHTHGARVEQRTFLLLPSVAIKYIVCLMHKEDPKLDILASDTKDTKVVSTCTKVTDLWGPIPNPYSNIEVQASSC